MRSYVERTVSLPLEADQVRDKSRVGESIYGDPFLVLDLLDDGLMTLSMAEEVGRIWFAKHGAPSEVEAGSLTVRCRHTDGHVDDLLLSSLS